LAKPAFRSLSLKASIAFETVHVSKRRRSVKILDGYSGLKSHANPFRYLRLTLSLGANRAAKN
jgi:hypothetical protein